MKIKQIEEEIRAKCILVNEDIVALKFGCEVNSNLGKLLFVYDEGKVQSGGVRMDTVDGYYCLYNFVDGRTVDPNDIDRKSIEITGRPLGIADILLAVGNEGRLKINNLGGFSLFENGEWQNLALPRFNLKETFENQTDETKCFIHSILLSK